MHTTLPVNAGGDDEAVLRATLEALDLPSHAVAAWLDQLERFYLGHGGERHYGECLDLVARLRGLLATAGT